MLWRRTGSAFFDRILKLRIIISHLAGICRIRRGETEKPLRGPERLLFVWRSTARTENLDWDPESLMGYWQANHAVAMETAATETKMLVKRMLAAEVVWLEHGAAKEDG